MLAWLVVLVAFVYGGDFLSLHLRIPNNRPQFGTVTVQRIYALHKTRGKADYIMGDPEQESCSNSLFPQLGALPCWWVRRHTQIQEDWY